VSNIHHVANAATANGVEKSTEVHTWDDYKKEERELRGEGVVGGPLAATSDPAPNNTPFSPDAQLAGPYRAGSDQGGRSANWLASSRRPMIDEILPGARRPRGDCRLLGAV